MKAAIVGSNAIFTAFCVTTCFTVPVVNLIRVTFCSRLALKKPVSLTREEKVTLLKVMSTLLSCS